MALPTVRERFKKLDCLKDLDTLKMRILYVIGAEDMSAPKDTMAEMAAVSRGCELVVLPRRAHIPNMENSQAFDAAISPFLRQSSREVAP